MQAVEWKQIPSTNYDVSNTGHIRCHNTQIEKVLNIHKDGYRKLSINNVTIALHRIVAWMFLGPPPSKEHIVDHKDRDKLNNDVTNLHYVTRRENSMNVGKTQLIRALADSNMRIIKVKPKRLLANVNPETFCQIKMAVVKKGITMQDAILVALLDFLKLDITLEQASLLEKMISEEEFAQLANEEEYDDDEEEQDNVGNISF